MTHEFKQIIEEAIIAKSKGLKTVMASVVDLDGSSYRRPGVRMLILENNTMIGAVSGGCVEKEVLLQSQSVFVTGEAKMMTYDGRYRLGCEGVLYILLEVLDFDTAFEVSFVNCLQARQCFEVVSNYKKQAGVFQGIGTKVKFDSGSFLLNIKNQSNLNTLVFRENMLPLFKLMIIGAEHDAVQLCKYAALTGWEVTVVASVSEEKSVENFDGVTSFISTTPEMLDTSKIDNQTAILLMTHNFANDLRYLVALENTTPNYIGILGPTKRREDLLAQFLEYCPDISEAFLESIHGPAGLNIGSETPQEIAISIIAEILTFTRKRNPIPLSKKVGNIHAKH
ncbi:XdhC/CoxI family protein [Flavobacteriaceae bacterium MHTCC 0001]